MVLVRARRSRKVASVSMFTALAVATDYAMFPLANIKVMDCIVFVAALTFGLEVGVAVGALTWLVYGEVNPLGPDGGLLLLILICSETIYAIFGCLAGRSLADAELSVPVRSLYWGSLGLIGAFVYDLITNVFPPLLSGSPLRVAILFLGPAAPFMVAHETSDFVFFAFLAPLLYTAIRKVAKRQVGLVSVLPQETSTKPSMSRIEPVLSAFTLNLGATLLPARPLPISLWMRPPRTPSKVT